MVVKGVPGWVTTRLVVAQIVEFVDVEQVANTEVKTEPGGVVTKRLVVVDSERVVPTPVEVSVGDDTQYAMRVGKVRGTKTATVEDLI